MYLYNIAALDYKHLFKKKTFKLFLSKQLTCLGEMSYDIHVLHWTSSFSDQMYQIQIIPSRKKY